VREIFGEWTEINEPFPVPTSHDIDFFHTHTQLCLTSEGQRALATFTEVLGVKKYKYDDDDRWQHTLARTFLQPVPGGDITNPLRRKARRFGLPELFQTFGKKYTAEVLYKYYMGTRILVHKQNQDAYVPQPMVCKGRRPQYGYRRGRGRGRGRRCLC